MIEFKKGNKTKIKQLLEVIEPQEAVENIEQIEYEFLQSETYFGLNKIDRDTYIFLLKTTKKFYQSLIKSDN